MTIAGIGEIHSIEATDLFRGKKMFLRGYFAARARDVQSREATLTDAQIADFSGRVVAALEKQLRRATPRAIKKRFATHTHDPNYSTIQ